MAAGAGAAAVEPKRLLILGGTGFIGRHLCRQLTDHGARVTVLSRAERKESSDDFGIERAIRQDLGWARPGEIVLRIPEEAPSLRNP